MHYLRRFLQFLLFSLVVLTLSAQTLYVPGGTNGIGNNTANGNVGIGTTSPSQMLYLKRTSVSNPGYNPVFGFGYDDAQVFGGSFGLRVTPGNARQGLKISSNLNLTFHSPVSGGNPAFQWQVGTISDESTDSGVAMTLTGQGNVGIGTTSPSSGLTVFTEGANYADGSYFLVGSTNSAFGGGATLAGIKTNAADGGNYNFLRLQNAGGTKFLINGAGNVGIGTTNPGNYKLAVLGKIRAQEVVVDTGWSDYVFRPDYQLASLSEVEVAIKRDGHLPGIPSAQEVAERGVSMGEMQSKLLAKIEELTLHVIAQEKRFQRLERENAELREKVSVLQSTRP